MIVEIYSIPNCPYCVKAKNLATNKGHEVIYNMMGEEFQATDVKTLFPTATFNNWIAMETYTSL